MLPDATLPVPGSLMGLLAAFAPLFTVPSFRTFCGLACGFLAQAGRRTVCGMLAGAGLSRAWSHDRAHQFFSRACWNADDLGLAVAKLVVALLVRAGQPVVVDDTLFKRRGRKVWAAGWFHDGSAPGPAKTGYGNNWVIGAIVVKLPMVSLSSLLCKLGAIVPLRLLLLCVIPGRGQTGTRSPNRMARAFRAAFQPQVPVPRWPRSRTRPWPSMCRPVMLRIPR
jgi:hypothetical protein